MPSAQDVVGVFDSNGNQLFADARAIHAVVNPTAKVMKQPLESGASTVDHIVFQPLEIELSVILTPADFPDTYQQILNVFEAAQTVTILTKTKSYNSMLMVAPPYDETADMIDTIAVAIKFEEADFVQAQYAQLPASWVKKKANASTVKTGQKNPTAATPPQSSTLYNLIFGSNQ